jgi:GT2 family glycosyltransferase
MPRSTYLQDIVAYFENHKDVGAVQGIVTKVNSISEIDSSGFLINESLELFSLHQSGFSLCCPIYLSFVEGTMPVYRLDALRSVLNNDNFLFINDAFMYYLEDVFVSLMLWNGGFKCVFLPIIVGEHSRGIVSVNSCKDLELFYYSFRNHVALIQITNSADRLRFLLHYLRWAILSDATYGWRQAVIRGMVEGLRIGKRLRKKFGIINLYETPMLKTSLKKRFSF